jgi:malate dehydrogenase (oxaloacetate-decarboxylating)(NADP+)
MNYYSIFRNFKSLEKKGLNYHAFPMPGKLKVQVSKSLKKRSDLALAYTPGVAEPCEAIRDDVSKAYDYTSKWNLVGVISNGTAVLGLGNIGAQASKPVMEGKSALFKYLSGIDSFDIEVDIKNSRNLADFVLNIGPTFGGINLEDVAAPECFEVDSFVREKSSIPFFHDDQSGTAVVAAAGLINAIYLVGKTLDSVKIVCSGAGAAAIAVLNFLVSMGLRRENCFVFDSKGLLTKNRNLDPYRSLYARDENVSLLDSFSQADIFIGLSVGNAIGKEHVEIMAQNPIIFAMANPVPEINPYFAKSIRSDAIVASGRSDFANQVNNVLCFPFIFRAALDVRVTQINHEMQLACVEGLSKVARSLPNFGRSNILPDAFDPTLIYELTSHIAKAAQKSGVATIDLPNNYNNFLDLMLYGEFVESVALPISFNDDADNVRRVFAYQNTKGSINKHFLALDLDSIFLEIQKESKFFIVFENHIIAFGENYILTTQNAKACIEKYSQHENFLGIITNDRILFNSALRPWFGVKLCSVEI